MPGRGPIKCRREHEHAVDGVLRHDRRPVEPRHEDAQARPYRQDRIGALSGRSAGDVILLGRIERIEVDTVKGTCNRLHAPRRSRFSSRGEGRYRQFADGATEAVPRLRECRPCPQTPLESL